MVERPTEHSLEASDVRLELVQQPPADVSRHSLDLVGHVETGETEGGGPDHARHGWLPGRQ
jgi:hypothetical protein